MSIGAFSISLSAKDIHKSKAFYESIGFTQLSGDIAQNWLIMQNGDVTIGLFAGMFEGNIMTFNPGWDNSAKPTDPFTDVRTLKDQWTDKGIMLLSDDTGNSGPGSFTIADPDGNVILIDQHRE